MSDLAIGQTHIPDKLEANRPPRNKENTVHASDCCFFYLIANLASYALQSTF